MRCRCFTCPFVASRVTYRPSCEIQISCPLSCSELTIVACPPASTLHDIIHVESQNSIPAETVAHVRDCLACQSLIRQWSEISKLDLLLEYFGIEPAQQPAPTVIAAVTPPIAPTVAYQRPPIRQIGQYNLLQRIGQGGCGEVFEAVHRRLHRRVAIKLLFAKDAGDEYARRRFLREMESIGRLNDPHIVQAHDAGEVDGVLYLAMEFVDGENIEAVARRCHPLPIPDACEIVRQAALGLQHAHEFEMVHRDIKPTNLLLSPTEVKIADLGMAHLQNTETGDVRLTGAYIVLGTADYMSPEQAEGSRHVDIRADLYSLGCTLFRLLAGRAPFAVPENDTAIKKLLAHANDPVPDIALLRREVTKDLKWLLAKLLAKNKADRFATPLELANALAPFCINADLKRLWKPLSQENVELRSDVPRRLPISTQPPTNQSVTADTIPLPEEGRTSRAYVVAIASAVLCLVALITGLKQHWKNSETVTLPNQTIITPVIVPQVAEPVAPAVKGVPDPVKPFEAVLLPPAAVNAPNQPNQLTLGRIGKVWQQQFGVAPSEVMWPGRAGLGTCRFEDELKSLVIQSRKTIRLVALGNFKKGDPALRLSVDLLPQSNLGEYGFFVGFQPEQNGNPFKSQFQAVLMRILSKTHTERNVLVRRCIAEINSETGQVDFGKDHFAMFAIPNQPEKLHFEIRLREASLPSIMLNDVKCHELDNDDRNSRFMATEFLGPFGVVARDTTVWFCNPQFERSAP